ncbi:hypothetical protein LTR09_011392 [Extremus antarcticus]|uniref:Stress-response A/B barrel domain-containing protein n=1 Tax=Extremus antarcticus TaxID=702011 RepID=A0AAJ0DBV7_9PEZI|nr:hypothetical protein LTR09_011392 [Extremus antarcticus]
MVVHHIVLFKLKPSTTKEQVSELEATVRGMVGQIPGLVKIEFGPPLESTAARAKGYNAGLIAVLEKPEDVKVYAEHPVHQNVHKLRESLCDDALAYDMVV